MGAITMYGSSGPTGKAEYESAQKSLWRCEDGMRDVRQELDRTRQQFHRLKYRDDIQIADCVNLGEETRKRLDCFYEHTVKNDVAGMRSCSDIYDIYVDPDRYYGGKPPEK